MNERGYPGDKKIEQDLERRGKLQEFGRRLIFGKRTERKLLDGDFVRDLAEFSVRKFSESGESDWYQVVMRNGSGEECAFGFGEADTRMSGDDGRDYTITHDDKELMKSVAIIER